jgi:hypothetical protein
MDSSRRIGLSQRALFQSAPSAAPAGGALPLSARSSGTFRRPVGIDSSTPDDRKALISLADERAAAAGASAVVGSVPESRRNVTTTLLASTHWLMEEDSGHRVVWLRRLPVPFTSITEITAANHAVIQQILPRHRTAGVVVDMRSAPPRNDPAFESAMRGLRSNVETRFARSAVLLATQVGMLQVNRITREDGATSFATTNEQTAFRFARGELV